MSTGSSNSNLGYGNENPFVTNSTFVNATSTNNPFMFGSNQRPTSCMNMKGGFGRRKRKYNRMSLYKMPRRRKSVRRGRLTHRRRKYSRSFKGGYAQYQNNQPLTNNYSLGGTTLSATNSALATPPPLLKNSSGCVDNYNHYTNKGYPSSGH